MNIISASENQVTQILVVALAILKSPVTTEEKIQALETTFLGKVLVGNCSIPFVSTNIPLVDEAVAAYGLELESLLKELNGSKIQTGVTSLDLALANNFKNILSTNFNKE